MISIRLATKKWLEGIRDKFLIDWIDKGDGDNLSEYTK